MYRQFFFNDTATTEIYTLSLHDALPISTKLPLPPPLSNPDIVPSYPSTWDPHFTRIGQRWYVAYVESPSQGGENWDHHPALARGGVRADLSDLTLVGRDAPLNQTEGMVMQKVAHTWYVLCVS